MSQTTCPVHATICTLDETIEAGRLASPKSRRLAEELLNLLNDVAWGRAGSEHLPAIDTLAQELQAFANEAAAALGSQVRQTLTDHREVFQSHVDTHNCATGACVKLVPAPCQMACPAGLDIPTFVTLIGMGRDAEAIDVIRKDNPFPWVCGLVCTRPCEFMCVRGRIDSAIAIKFLRAFASERSMSERHYRNPPKQPDKKRKVCIVGAGPAGLSAAYYLALQGYGVRVIEALPMAGGMLMVGIPRYRLPREVIDREVAMIQELGVEIAFNTFFGRDVTLDQLKEDGFEAFLFTIGAHKSIRLNIPGEDAFPQVVDAIDFLKRVAVGDRRVPGRKAIVIGGGNVAIDAARTCIRLGCEEVRIAYRRSRADMPADVEEAEQAEAEGVHIDFLTVPIEITGSDGQVSALQCLRAELKELEGSRRKFPVSIEGSDFSMDADVIIPAIGEVVAHEALGALKGLKWTRRQTIDVDLVSMQASIPGIFAAGDAVSGPATVVEAIGGGKRAAEAIDRYLSGIPQPKMPPVPVRRGRMPFLETTAADKTTHPRPPMPLLNINRRRTTFQQVELGYSEEAAREEARRCLRCDICRRCGRCVEVCRDKMGINALQMGYFDFDHPVATDFRVTEERCIACGACAANCPNEAMRIENREGERILSLCGTVLTRQKLVFCDACGAVMGPARYLEYVRKRTQAVGRVTDNRSLCEACARKESAKANVDIAPVETPKTFRG